MPPQPLPGSRVNCIGYNVLIFPVDMCSGYNVVLSTMGIVIDTMYQYSPDMCNGYNVVMSTVDTSGYDAWIHSAPN